MEALSRNVQPLVCGDVTAVEVGKNYFRWLNLPSQNLKYETKENMTNENVAWAMSTSYTFGTLWKVIGGFIIIVLFRWSKSEAVKSSIFLVTLPGTSDSVWRRGKVCRNLHSLMHPPHTLVHSLLPTLPLSTPSRYPAYRPKPELWHKEKLKYVLKGQSGEILIPFFWLIEIGLGLNTNRFGFYNFSDAPTIL